jgi:hypothetical protein
MYVQETNVHLYMYPCIYVCACINLYVRINVCTRDECGCRIAAVSMYAHYMYVCTRRHLTEIQMRTHLRAVCVRCVHVQRHMCVHV